jgi:hypothetical protein
MSKHKDDMPEDIKRSARKAYDETLVSIVGKDAEDDVIAVLERAILAERRSNDWQPIETAPKDGTNVLVWVDGYFWPETVFYEKYDADEAAEIGAVGFWRYSDEVLADIAEVEEDLLMCWMPIVSPAILTPSTVKTEA